MFRRVLIFLIKGISVFAIVSILSVIAFRFIPVPVTPLMLIRCSQQLFEGKEMRLKKDWEPIENMSQSLPLAIIASEDQNFMDHNGFDLQAIEKAIKHNEKHKRKRGASTISQQTAKNVFLWPGRSWIRKGFEVYFTVLIELFWDKERIMEMYLNVVEFGKGVYGAEAASREFFNKPAQKMLASECAMLAVVLPNPRKYSAVRPGNYLRKRQQWVLGQMNNIGRLDFEKGQ